MKNADAVVAEQQEINSNSQPKSETVGAAAKSKSKKDKLNKAKMLSKQNTIDSLKSNEDIVVNRDPNTQAIPIENQQETCPFKVAIENAKTKRPKRKKKEILKEDSSIASEDISVKYTAKKGMVKEATTNVNEAKEKKIKGGGEKKKMEKDYSQCCKSVSTGGECTLVSEIAKARQHIKNSLERMDGIAAMASTPGKDVLDRISSLEKENSSLRDVIEKMRKTTIDTQERIKQLEIKLQSFTIGGGQSNSATVALSKSAANAAASNKESDEDDGVDLFASDSEEEDEEAAKVREQRLAEYAAKKSKKPTLIAKSNVILDIKPWDDETDMKLMESKVREIKLDGLLWGAAKLVPLAYGIHKLQIATVIEDDKVSVDLLTEEIEKIDDYVQSVDIAAFNKI